MSRSSESTHFLCLRRDVRSFIRFRILTPVRGKTNVVEKKGDTPIRRWVEWSGWGGLRGAGSEKVNDVTHASRVSILFVIRKLLLVYSHHSGFGVCTRTMTGKKNEVSYIYVPPSNFRQPRRRKGCTGQASSQLMIQPLLDEKKSNCCMYP